MVPSIITLIFSLMFSPFSNILNIKYLHSLPESSRQSRRQTIRVSLGIDAGTQCVRLFGFVTQLICIRKK